MLDNNLIIAIKEEIENQLSDNSLGDVLVKQSYQPTQQAASEERIISISKVSNPQVGTGFKCQGTTRTQEHLKRATFQIDALAQQDPTNINSLTASDIANIAADLLQSYSAVRNLQAKGVNIERVTEVRPSYFVNDKDRHESAPSFDLTVNYIHSYENEIPAITGINVNNYGV